MSVVHAQVDQENSDDLYEWQLREYPNIHGQYNAGRERYNEALAEKHLRLKNTKKKLLKENSMMKVDIKEQKSLLHLQDKRIKELQKFNERLREEWEALDTANKAKEADKQRLVEDTLAKKAEIELQKANNITLSEEAEILKEEFALKNSEYAELNSFYEEKEMEVAQAQDSVDRKQKEYDELKSNNEMLSSEYEEKQREYSELEELVLMQKEENERIEKELDQDLESFYSKLLRFYEQEGTELREKLEDYKGRKVEVESKLEDEQL